MTKRDLLLLKHYFYRLQDGRCAAPCDFHTEGLGKRLHIDDLQRDHIHPKSKYGPDTIDNYQLLCADCNQMKSDLPLWVLHLKLEIQREAYWQRIQKGIQKIMAQKTYAPPPAPESPLRPNETLLGRYFREKYLEGSK